MEFWKNFLSTQIFAHLTQLFVLHCEDNFQVIKGINPQRHMILISKMRPSCQTLSNAFEVSRKTHLHPQLDFQQMQFVFHALLMTVKQYMSLQEEIPIENV